MPLSQPHGYPRFAVITHASQLPAPSGGKITLDTSDINVADAIFLTSDVNIGANRLYVTGGKQLNIQGPGTLIGSGPSLIEVANNSFLHIHKMNLFSATGDGVVVNNTPGVGSVVLDAVNLFAATGKGVRIIGAYSLVCNNTLLQCLQPIHLTSVVAFSFISCAFSNYATGIILDDTLGAMTVGNITAGFFLSAASATARAIDVTTSPMRFTIANSEIRLVAAGQSGIVSTTGSYTVQGLVLNGLGFPTGVGTPISGVTAQQQQASFSNCFGIENTAPAGFAIVFGGAALTTLTLANTYYLLAATTTLISSQLWTHDGAGGFTNSSGRRLNVKVTVQCDGLTSTPTGDYYLAVAVDGVPIMPPSFGRATSSSLPSLRTSVVVNVNPGSKVQGFILRTVTAGTTFTWQNGFIEVSNAVNA